MEEEEEEEDKEEEEARRGGEVEKRVGVHAKAEVATCVWSVCLLGSTGVKALLVQSRMRVTLCDRRAIGWHRVEGGEGVAGEQWSI